MLYSIRKLVGYSIGAIDGQIGNVKEFYFDDDSWTIRYLVVETGSLLFSRKILISPQAILPSDLEDNVFPVNLTIQQIENSSDIDTEKPVSRQQEIKLHKHYNWINYWKKDAHQTDEKTNAHPHLRNATKIIHYFVKANDGDVGKLAGFLIDINTWEIKFIEVQILVPEKRVILLPTLVKEINWENSTVFIDDTMENIKKSQEYITAELVDKVDKTSS